MLWPPPYQIKKHRLARSVKLRIHPTSGLQITTPDRFNLADIPFVLEKHKAWISKHLLKIQPLPTTELPEQIFLATANQTWKVHYLACQAKLELIQRPLQELALVGKIADKKLCQEKLTAWVKEQAKIILSAQLNDISEKTRLPYQRLILRDQKTLWGSCTFRKSISLNYKLLFLPEHLTAHVMIHELCHTQHLNHSEAFWKLVAQHDPAWQEHRRALRRARQFVPGWCEVGF